MSRLEEMRIFLKYTTIKSNTMSYLKIDHLLSKILTYLFTLLLF